MVNGSQEKLLIALGLSLQSISDFYIEPAIFEILALSI